MRRALSLMLLAVGSLTLDVSSLAAQTWVVNSGSIYDTLPRISIDTMGYVKVIWLAKDSEIDDYEVNYNWFDGSNWNGIYALTDDTVNQHYCQISTDRLTNNQLFCWDSCGFIISTIYRTMDNTWNYATINDSFSLLVDDINFYDNEIYCDADDNGNFYIGWSADTFYYMAYVANLYTRKYTGVSWDSIKQVTDLGSYDINAFYLKDIDAIPNNKPIYGVDNLYDGMVPGYWGDWLLFLYWEQDSMQYSLVTGYGSTGGTPFRFVGNTLLQNYDLLVLFTRGYSPNHNDTLFCERFNYPNYSYDTTNIINAPGILSGTLSKSVRPTLAWSNGSQIFLTAFYDTIWTEPIQISSSGLSNCVAPDIDVEKDSIAWVCYKSNNNIYVTRTSVPTGVTTGPTELQITTKIQFSVYPNPTSGPVRFSFNLFRNSTGTINIYDIAGRRVRALGNASAWDGTAESGARAAPGVYFARLVCRSTCEGRLQSGPETKTIKLTIIK